VGHGSSLRIRVSSSPRGASIACRNIAISAISGPSAAIPARKKNFFWPGFPKRLDILRRSETLSRTRYAAAAALAPSVNDYPRAPLLEVLQAATQYGLFDLDRVESMVLRKLAREYFQIKPDPDDGEEG